MHKIINHFKTFQPIKKKNFFKLFFKVLSNCIFFLFFTGTQLLTIGGLSDHSDDLNGNNWGITCDQFVNYIISDRKLKEIFSEVVDISSVISKFRKRRFERLSSFTENA